MLSHSHPPAMVFRDTRKNPRVPVKLLEIANNKPAPQAERGINMNANKVYEKCITILNDYCKKAGYSYDFMMNNLNNIANGIVKNDKNKLFGNDTLLLNIIGVAYDAKCEILNTKIKNADSKKPSTAALKRILKNTSNKNMIQFQKSWIDEDVFGNKRQIVMNPYQLVVLNDIDESLPCKSESDSYTTFNYKQILTSVHENAVKRYSIAYEDLLTDVKLYLQNLKAKGVKKSEKNDHPYIIDLGEPTKKDDNQIGINADYLKDMLDALPNCEIYFSQGLDAWRSPIYFKSEDGEGILLPIKIK